MFPLPWFRFLKQFQMHLFCPNLTRLVSRSCCLTVERLQMNRTDESILRSIMNVQCKNLKTKKVDLMVLKTRGSCIQQIRKISSLSKLAKHIFTYRHPKSTILSFWSAFGFIIKSFLSKRMLAVFLPIPETREHYSITRTCSYVGIALYFLLRVSK